MPKSKASDPVSDVRRERILVAALHEFTTHGFRAASTNTIAQNADVAKGLVFHYFGSKEELFFTLYQLVVARTAEQFAPTSASADLFERLHEWSVRKMELFQRDPGGYQFLLMARAEAPDTVRARIDALQDTLTATYLPMLFNGLDTSRLRAGITLERAFEVITLLVEGIERRLTARLASLPDRGVSQMPAISESIWQQILLLRDGVYRRAE